MEKIIIVIAVCILSLIETYAMDKFRDGLPPEFDCCVIGNALYDIEYSVSDEMLTEWGLVKDETKWVSASEMDNYDQLLKARGCQIISEGSGGSGINTAGGMSRLGLNVAIMGVVSDDQIGEKLFTSYDSNKLTFLPVPSVNPLLGTGQCIVLITPDGKRTMITNLGVSKEISCVEDYIQIAAKSKYVIFETFLFEPELTYNTMVRLAEETKKNGNYIILSLSAEFLAIRYRDRILEFISQYANIVIGNEAEAIALTGTCSGLCAAQYLLGMNKVAAVTCGENGSFIAGRESNSEACDEEALYKIESPVVYSVIDTVGAGDQYLAGLTWSLFKGLPLADAGKIATLCAVDVIGKWGALPHHDMKAGIAHKEYAVFNAIKIY